MRNLAIQLSRSRHTTTHRPRWVVWLLGSLFVLVCITYTSRAWFLRSELLIAAPTDTEIAIEMQITKRNYQKITRLFEHIPIISERSLELVDILPFTQGKIALFIQNDGTSSVAIKAKIEDIPMELFDANHINVQEIASNVVLLSPKLLALAPLSPKGHPIRWTPDLFAHVIGIITFPKAHSSEFITMNTDSLSFKIKNMEYPKINHSMPDDTYAFLSTVVSTNTDINMLDHFDDQTQMQKILKEDSWIFLTKQVNQQGFLFWSETPDSFDRHEFIKEMSASLSPKMVPWTMKDGTKAQEIILDPDASSIEEITINGMSFYHSKSQKGDEFYLSKEKALIFSNNENDVRSFLQPKEKQEAILCNANVIGMNIHSLLAEEKRVSKFYTHSFLRNISTKYNNIGVRTSGSSIKATFCL